MNPEGFWQMPRLWWRERWLLVGVVERELRGRYVGSIGGLVWILVHPLILLAIYTMVFQAIFRVRLPEMGASPFVVFAALGLWPWLMFQEGLQRASQAIKANSTLVRKVAFQQELLVFAATLAAFAAHLVGFLIALLALALFGVDIHWSGLPMALALVAGLFLFTLAVGLCLAVLQVFIPDMEQILGPILSVLFYATPVLYPLMAAPEWLRGIMTLNPVLHFVEPIRAVLLGNAIEAETARPFVLVAAPLLIFPALLLFRRLSPYTEDFL